MSDTEMPGCVGVFVEANLTSPRSLRAGEMSAQRWRFSTPTALSVLREVRACR